MQQMAVDIEQLQMKVAFQEDTIESLNQALIEQQKQLEELQFSMRQLANKLRAIEPSQLAPEHEETPPPHY
jgi:SlyX protein